MLAQNFKTPTDLGIADAEFDALYKVLGMLEREEIPHFPAAEAWEVKSAAWNSIPRGFNMVLVKSETDCGTAACICGWARVLSGTKEMFCGDLPDELSRLFMMGGNFGIGKPSHEMLPADAAIALRNYLTHGEARWAQAVAAY